MASGHRREPFRLRTGLPDRWGNQSHEGHGPVKLVYASPDSPAPLLTQPDSHTSMLAFEMRQNPTKAERLLREALKALQPIHFHHKAVLNGVIADFYCPDHKLAINLTSPQLGRVKQRQIALISVGIRVLHFPTYQVVRDANAICQYIQQFIAALDMNALT